MPVNSRALPDANLTPCHVGIVFAMPLEAEPLERRLTGLIAIQSGKFAARQGGWKGKAVVVVRSGVGRENAAAATDSLILGHRPRWVVSAGLAGGLRADLKRNDVVLGNAILGDRGQRLSIDLRLSSHSTSGASDSRDFHIGPLLTIDQVVFKPDQKRELAETTGAIAVDMETLAVAEVCHREQQRFLAVRAICDTIDDQLPADVERLVRKKTLARRIGAAAGTIIRRPSTVKDLWRFREAAIVASQRLAKFLEGVIEQLD